MFLNFIQKGWVGEAERKGRCVTAVERRNGGNTGDGPESRLRCQRAECRFCSCCHNFVRLLGALCLCFLICEMGYYYMTYENYLLNRGKALWEYTKCLMLAIIFQTYHVAIPP